ncbi:PD-(D/E)XK motif protein [Arthrobacter sp. MMS24-T111]
MTSYEALLHRIATLESPESSTEREIAWATPRGVVGLSRTNDGKLEIFLSGPELAPSSRPVREALDYQTWHRARGLASFEANRLVLPSVGHYDQVAAFICVELIRRGADENLALAFAEVEPIIALSIKRLRLSDQALLGLAGELLIFEALTRQVDDAQLAMLLGAWDGWRESLRDFSWGGIGIEVKTTTRSTSSHTLQGIHQIERQDGDENNGPEAGLFLISIGLDWVADADGAYSIPMLVDSIITRVDSAPNLRGRLS